MILEDFQTSCGCIVLAAGQVPLAGLSKVELASGEVFQVNLEVSVRTPPGTRIRDVIRFRTNDPSRTDAVVEIVADVEGDLVAVPSELILGNISTGTVLTRIIEVRDTGCKRSPGALRIVSSHPEQVKIIGVTPSDEAVIPPNKPGRLLERVTVQVRAPDNPGSIRASISLSAEGDMDRSPVSVAIQGRAVGKYKVAPNTLILPKASESGYTFRASCICQRHDGKEFALTIVEKPRELTVSLSAFGGGGFLIEAKLDPMEAALGVSRVIKLKAEEGSERCDIVVPVLSWRPE